MRRREFIALAGGAAAMSVARSRLAVAEPAAIPVIGFLHSGSAEANAKRVAQLFVSRGGRPPTVASSSQLRRKCSRISLLSIWDYPY